MFRAVRAPGEPSYATSLSAFGYHMNEKREFVDNTTGAYFDFFHCDNDRVNDGRRGAFQQCLRTEIASVLKSEHGIEELFVGGSDGHVISYHRPVGQHISLLATEQSKLRQKRDVIVVVGESSQDCGIWAWRSVQREGGADKGSLAGLVQRITLRAATETRAGNELVEEQTPGIIVLNPGQLAYSHQLGRNMSLASWQSRLRPTAISEPYALDKKYNFVPGHQNSSEHVHTVVRHVLPQLTAGNARLHIVAIGDGSTPTLEVLSQQMAMRVGGIPESIALIETGHEHEEILNGDLKTFLSLAGKSWVQSDEPKGTKLAMPDGPLLGMPALSYAPGTNASSQDVNGHNFTIADDQDGAGAFFTQDRDLNMVTDLLGHHDVNDSSRDDLSEASTIIAVSPELPDIDDSKDFFENKENIEPRDFAPLHPNTDGDSPHVAIELPLNLAINSPPAMDVPPNTPADTPPALDMIVDEVNGEGNDITEDTLATTDFDPEVGEEEDNEDDDDDEGGEEDKEPSPEPPAPVSCPTFSAGVCDGVIETVFPAVMDDVLDHLWFHITRVREHDAKEAADAAANGVAWPREGERHDD